MLLDVLMQKCFILRHLKEMSVMRLSQGQGQQRQCVFQCVCLCILADVKVNDRTVKSPNCRLLSECEHTRTRIHRITQHRTCSHLSSRPYSILPELRSVFVSSLHLRGLTPSTPGPCRQDQRPWDYDGHSLSTL